MNMRSMDSNSSPQNWLAFSLSNHHPQQQPSSSSHLCLFEAFTSSPSTPTAPTSATNASAQEEDAAAAAAAATTGATELSMFSGGPKLEDFLGCSSTVAAGGGHEVAPQHEQQQLPHYHHFSAETPVTVSDTDILYDSELKTIAASFLRGFSTQQTDTHKQQQQQQRLQVVPTITAEHAASKRPVDTFGQRTSIYRGVTR